jgi:hypothetical protein
MTHLSWRTAERWIGPVLVTALVAGAPAGAAARNGVYGGSTRAGDPIVITTDAKGKKLVAAAFRMRLESEEGWWPIYGTAKVTSHDPDGVIPSDALVTSRNAKGRFTASFMTHLSSSPTANVLAGIKLSGSLTPAKAGGTISGWLTVTDPATTELAGFYTAPETRWTAERSPGRVYGGTLGGDQPIVIKLNKPGTKVVGLRFSYYTTQSTPPDMSLSRSESMTNFPLVRGRFGDSWTQPERYPNGDALSFNWTVAGRVTPKSAKGTIALTAEALEGATGNTFQFQLPTARFTAASG